MLQDTGIESERHEGAVDRALSVLKLFIDPQRSSLGVTEIADQLSLSKGAVHRALTSLRKSGLLDTDPKTRRYVLGLTALTLGLAYQSHQDLHERARPFLRALSERTGETATLSMRRGDKRIYLDQVTPNREVKMTVPLGEPQSLHAGSSSKAFLAFLSPREQEEYIAGHELTALTDLTITNPDALREELDIIRKRGYAQSLGERQSGSASVAAPVFNHEGVVVATVSVCGPRERFRPNMNEAAKVLLEQTRDFSTKLGFNW